MEITDIFSKPFKHREEADALLYHIKSLGKKPRQERKAYVSPYAKFDRIRRKRK